MQSYGRDAQIGRLYGSHQFKLGNPEIRIGNQIQSDQLLINLNVSVQSKQNQSVGFFMATPFLRSYHTI